LVATMIFPSPSPPTSNQNKQQKTIMSSVTLNYMQALRTRALANSLYTATIMAVDRAVEDVEELSGINQIQGFVPQEVAQAGLKDMNLFRAKKRELKDKVKEIALEMAAQFVAKHTSFNDMEYNSVVAKTPPEELKRCFILRSLPMASSVFKPYASFLALLMVSPPSNVWKMPPNI